MKCGKTTLAVKFPKNILFAVEQGYNAINNINAYDIPDWKEFKLALKDLDDAEVKEMFDTVTIDTVSLLYQKCEEYICAQNGVDKIGDIDYGAGYQMVDREFENGLREITRLKYGMVLICHEKTRIDTDGQKSTKNITLDVSDRCAKIINRMVDLTAYIRKDETGKRWIYPRATTITEGNQTYNIYAGSHFANLNDKIELSYGNLVEAISSAMEQTAKDENYKMTDKVVEIKQADKVDFKATVRTVGKYANILKMLDETLEEPVHMDAYFDIAGKYIGKGKKVSACTEAQADQVYLIMVDLEKYMDDHNIKYDA